MVSYRARPFATGAGITGHCILTTFVENTVIVGLFKGEPHALIIITAGLKAVLKIIHIEGIDEDATALECPMAFASRTAGIDSLQKCIKKENQEIGIVRLHYLIKNNISYSIKPCSF